MQCEEEERGGDADSDDPDPFIAEGMSSSDEDSDSQVLPAERYGNGSRKSQGKAKRKLLKELYFAAKEKRSQRRAERRAQGLL